MTHPVNEQEQAAISPLPFATQTMIEEEEEAQRLAELLGGGHR